MDKQLEERLEAVLVRMQTSFLVGKSSSAMNMTSDSDHRVETRGVHGFFTNPMNPTGSTQPELMGSVRSGYQVDPTRKKEKNEDRSGNELGVYVPMKPDPTRETKRALAQWSSLTHSLVAVHWPSPLFASLVHSSLFNHSGSPLASSSLLIRSSSSAIHPIAVFCSHLSVVHPLAGHLLVFQLLHEEVFKARLEQGT
ncbi:RluA family uridine synthase [Sesbania bispinosa]|nr:RluA family uridine synthase [Sesbania bispinosa]